LRILLSGLSGTGSTTAAKRIAADLGLEYVYGGQIFRNLAVERGVSLEELAESLEQDQDTEREIDRRLIAAGTQDDVLIEGRTIGWIFPWDVPALSIWLTCDLEERLQRVQGREHHPRSAENLLRREASDNRRYQALYGIEPEDYSPFDLVVDTTTLPVEQVVEAIEAFVRERVPDQVGVPSWAPGKITPLFASGQPDLAERVDELLADFGER
jgi:CMP/dCMP kinase